MATIIDVDRFWELLEGQYPVVFGGYSGLGYEKPEAVRHEVRKTLKNLKEKYGDRLLVISGATSVGIGLVYEVASKMDLPTLGIVSDQVKPEDISGFCESVFLVCDPRGTWEVKTEAGDSYMVEAARNGEMICFGGGQVAAGEIMEARGKNIAVTVLSDFRPGPEKVQLKARQKK